MESATLAITAIAVALVVALRPVYGTVVYLTALLAYPMYLRVSVGTIDLSAHRMIIAVLVIRCLCDRVIVSRFRWNLMDTTVLLAMFLYAIPLLFTTPSGVAIENRGGFFLDTMMPYLAIRLVVTSRAEFVILVKGIALTVSVLAVLGAIEAHTGYSPYKGFLDYKPWESLRAMRTNPELDQRYGFFRAMGPTGHPIMFGLVFGILAPLVYLLRLERPPWRLLAYALLGMTVLGTLASMSSGPWLALLIILICLGLEHAKVLVRPSVWGLLTGLILLEILTRKHFYHFLARFTMNADTAWYRARLLDVAIIHLPEYWLVGYGLVDPGWGPELIGSPYTDIVNHYVLIAVQHGLPGLAGFLAILSVSLVGLSRRHRVSRSSWERSYVWAVGAPIVGLAIVFFSVSLFDQPVTILHIVFALAGGLYIPKPASRSAMHFQPRTQELHAT